MKVNGVVMRIGRLAAESGVAPSRVRFYEAHGLLPPPARRGNGYRDYPSTMVATLRFIDQAQALGFSLKESGAVLPTAGTAHAARTILSALQRKLADVEAHIAASRALRARLLLLIAEQEACFEPEAERLEG